MIGTVYLARKGGMAVHHTDLEAMKAVDGIDAPETAVSEAEFETAGGLARIINGALETDAELRGIDAKSAGPDEYETGVDALRSEKSGLLTGAAG
jgi:hypothetical protein